jgi:hypothetical protein
MKKGFLPRAATRIGRRENGDELEVLAGENA